MPSSATALPALPTTTLPRPVPPTSGPPITQNGGRPCTTQFPTARYSSNLQKPSSIGDQVRLCQERADSIGGDVVRVHSDYESTATTGLSQSALDTLLLDAKRGHIDIVVVEALDRISRDQEHIHGIHKRLQFSKIRLVNLGNFMGTLALPDAVEQRSLTGVREKLIKIGATIVRHGRYVTFQMAEVVIPRDLFADILRRIDRLRPPPAPA